MSVMDHHAAERRLARVEAAYEQLANQIPAMVYRYRLVEPRGFEFVSDSVTELVGYTPDEHYADPDLGRRIVHPDDLELLDRLAATAGPLSPPPVLRWVHRDGRSVWTEHRLSMLEEDGTPAVIQGVVVDVTDRYLRELADQDEHVAEAARARLAAAALATNDLVGLAGEAVRTLRSCFVEASIGVWMATAADADGASGGSLRLIAGSCDPHSGGHRGLDVPIGVVGRIVIDPAPTSSVGRRLLESTSELLAITAARLDAEAQRTRAIDRLSTAMTETIEMAGRLVELRDPYTAGHQQRCADLADQISTELGLDENARQAVRVGALLHDVGKAALPADILNKAGRLDDIEFELVKTHVIRGEEIIRTVEFPWPVLPVVAQHHERLDGSGYPRGLRGDEISLGARILAVVDVFEAMSAHRPYRAALGPERALEELRAGAGSWYDAAVVRALDELWTSGRLRVVQ